MRHNTCLRFRDPNTFLEPLWWDYEPFDDSDVPAYTHLRLPPYPPYRYTVWYRRPRRPRKVVRRQPRQPKSLISSATKWLPILSPFCGPLMVLYRLLFDKTDETEVQGDVAT